MIDLLSQQSRLLSGIRSPVTGATLLLPCWPRSRLHPRLETCALTCAGQHETSNQTNTFRGLSKNKTQTHRAVSAKDNTKQRDTTKNRDLYCPNKWDALVKFTMQCRDSEILEIVIGL